MGTYLVGGIAVRIKIVGNKNYNVIHNKNKIKRSFDKIIDTSFYEILEHENSLELTIKKEMFENNIHDLIKEISPIMNMRVYFFANMYKENIDINEFNKRNYPISLNIRPTEYANTFYLNDGEISERQCYPDYSYMILRDDEDNLMHNVNVYLSFINIWIDPSNIDEYPLGTINVLNKLTKKSFKNNLVKSMFFYID